MEKHLGNELNVIKLLTAFTKCVLSRHVFVTLNRLFLNKRLPKMCLEHNHLREQNCQILLLFSRSYFFRKVSIWNYLTSSGVFSTGATSFGTGSGSCTGSGSGSLGASSGAENRVLSVNGDGQYLLIVEMWTLNLVGNNSGGIGLIRLAGFAFRLVMLLRNTFIWCVTVLGHHRTVKRP